MRQTPPIQFAEIGLDINSFSYSDKKSWRGACPACGGHRRFVMFIDKEYPYWNGYCSLCGHDIKVWEKMRKPIDPRILKAYEAKRAAQEAREAAERKQRLERFIRGETWEEYNKRMSEENRQWWDSQGVPDAIQDELCLGWTAERKYRDNTGELRKTSAYTIPWFGIGRELKTMQYRLENPVNLSGKYRFEQGLGGGKHYYMTTPDKPIGDKVIICEGAKKAIVTQFWLQNGYTVIAASSNNTIKAALDATQECGLRYIVLDPDSEYWERVAKQSNPKTTHIVSLPFKIDDGFLQYGLTLSKFSKILDTSL